MLNISRGEIWLVTLDPTVGAEIRKTRPVVVVSSDAVGELPIKLVAPLTEWKDYFMQNVWHVKVTPDSKNGLTKTLAVDTLQLRGVDIHNDSSRNWEACPLPSCGQSLRQLQRLSSTSISTK